MNPESKVYLIIGLIIVSSSLVTAGFAYLAFRAALRRSLNALIRVVDIETATSMDESR
jgi:hypothetical protein